MNRITIKDLVNHMSTEPASVGMTKRAIREFIDTLIEYTADHLKDGDEILLSGLGKIKTEIVHRPEHTARNPKTGETVKVEAKNTVRARLLLEKTLRTEMTK